MSNQEQLEKVLIDMASRFEAVADNFGIAIKHINDRQEPKWFTPKKMVLNFVRIGALASPPEIQILACAIHGAVDILGFSGTAKLVLGIIKKRRQQRGGKS